MTCLEISCFFQILTMSGMSSAHRGCRATPLGGDQGCGRPPRLWLAEGLALANSQSMPAAGSLETK